MSKTGFMSYPDYQQPEFYQDIYSKKQFNETKSLPFPLKTHLDKYLEDSCNPKQFNLQKYQEFVRNFVSGPTNYNGLLMFWGVGTGKCLLPDTNVYVNGHLEKIQNLWAQTTDEHIVKDEELGEWKTLSKELLINTYNEESHQIMEFPVKRLYRQKICEPIRHIILKNGSQLRMTTQHHVLTEQGWTNQLSNVKSVSIPKVLKNETNISPIGLDLAKFLGWQIAIASESEDRSQMLFPNLDHSTCYDLVDMFVNVCDQYKLNYKPFIIENC